MAGEVQTTLEALSICPSTWSKDFTSKQNRCLFANASNKIRLQAFLLGEFKQRIEGREEMFSTETEKKCILLNTGEEIREFDCSLKLAKPWPSIWGEWGEYACVYGVSCQEMPKGFSQKYGNQKFG